MCNRHPWLFLSTALALLLATVLSISPTRAAAAESSAAPADAQSAMWTPKQLHFLFQGFTAHYSCDGLEDKIRHALKELGARGDLEVHSTGCSSPLGRPDPFPAVNIKMSVLEPAPDTATATNLVAAHWKRVDLHLERDPVWEAGDCELLEQIKQKILPLFATRNVDFESNCVPHQAMLGTRLSADLLVAEPKDMKPSAH
ncbi:MAG TPA: hypothetical protein VNX02_07250 [Steroidobacteraceae bacterium]|jgi:hypothetical protein|nr:hypothetical protein [Steroidobacteraceae bacterium]